MGCCAHQPSLPQGWVTRGKARVGGRGQHRAPQGPEAGEPGLGDSSRLGQSQIPKTVVVSVISNKAERRQAVALLLSCGVLALSLPPCLLPLREGAMIGNHCGREGCVASECIENDLLPFQNTYLAIGEKRSIPAISLPAGFLHA